MDSLADAARKELSKYVSLTLGEWINTISPDGSPPSQDAVNSFYVPTLNEQEISITENLLASSLLLGMDHGSSQINLSDESISLKPLPFEEAISFLKGRVSVTKKEWNNLEPKLRFRAFTMARLSQCDYIEAARGRLISAMKDGDGFAKAWADVKAIAKEDGSAISPGYWENVYRTNTQTCYNTGKWMEYEKNPPEALALLVIDDRRTSSICKPLIGLVLPYDHPFWKSNWPPFHFSCRTTTRRVEKHEIGKTIQVENTPMNTLRKKFKPQDGFGSNPSDSGNWWMLRSPQIERGISYGIISEFNKSDNVIADFSSVWKNYSRVPGKNGGWFDLTQSPPNDWPHNKPVVENLSDNGFKIKVIPEFKNIKNQEWKNPDIFIDGVMADIKEPVALTSNAIKNALKSAQTQNLTTVILNIKNDMNKTEIVNGLQGRIGMKENKIDRIILLYKGKILDISANDVRTKKLML